jgi:hypothetical protein
MARKAKKKTAVRDLKATKGSVRRVRGGGPIIGTRSTSTGLLLPAVKKGFDPQPEPPKVW